MQSVRLAGLILCFLLLSPGLSLANHHHFPLLLTDTPLSLDPLRKSDPFWQSVLDAPGLFERKALEIPPTHPSFSLNFPFTSTRRVLWDTGYILTAPARWDRWGWAKFSLFAVVTGGIWVWTGRLTCFVIYAASANALLSHSTENPTK